MTDLQTEKKGVRPVKHLNRPKRQKRARTLSESRSNNYGITPPATTSTRTLQSGLQQVDYLTL